MTKYIVARREVWVQNIEIEADSIEDAIKAVHNGKGEMLEGPNDLEFSHELDSSLWTVHDENGVMIHG